MSQSAEPPFELPIYLDSSMIATYRSCHKKFFWSYIQNLVLDGANIHLTAGGALAVAMDTIRRAQFGKDPLSVDDLMHLAIGPFLKVWNNLQIDDDHAKSIHRVLLALEKYLELYHPATDEVQPLARADGTPTSEFTFAIPLPVSHPSGDPFIYCGRFDLLGRHTVNDILVVLDEKTTGSLSTAWTRQWDMRGQFLGYVWACQQLGYSVQDVIVRGIGMYKTGPQFLAVPSTYPKHLIDRWYEQLLVTVNEIRWCYENEQWAYDFADACSSYGGCPYVDLCKSRNPSNWFTNYSPRTWSPIQHVEGL
jgi:hypothetical protein